MTSPTVTEQERHEAAPAAVRRTLRERLQQFLAFASLIVIFVFFSIASPQLLQLRQRHEHPVRDGRDGHAGARHDVRHHHRRHRPLDRHRDDPVRGDGGRVHRRLRAAALGSGCSAPSCSAG